MMNLKDLIAEDSLQGVLEEQIAEQKAAETKQRARLVASRLMQQVEQVRSRKRALEQSRDHLKSMKKAIEDFDKSGDTNILVRAGLL